MTNTTGSASWSASPSRRNVARRCLTLVLVTAIAACAGETTEVSTDVQRIQITPRDPRVQAGNAMALAVRATDDRGQTVATPAVQWSSDDSRIATVGSSGVVTAVSPGTARIAASSMGQSDVVTVTVTPRPIISVGSLSPSRAP